jgi:hypothetical protein
MAATTTPPQTSNGAPSRAGGAGRAPARPAVAGATQRAARRNRTRIAAGVVLMLACALGIGVAFANAAERTPVLVVDHPIRVGQTIEASDLREVLVGSTPANATIAASRRATVIGRTAAVDLAEGSLLAPSQLTSGPAAETGRAVIGASLKSGQYPAELAAGDRVLVITLPPDSETSTDRTSTPSAIAATVVGVHTTDSGEVSVSLAVDPDEATQLAIAGARQRLSVVLAP